MDLTISTRFDKITKTIEVHPNLPKVPFYTLISGAGASGKSLALVNLIDKLGDVFKKGMIFAFTNSFCLTLTEIINKKKGMIFDEIINKNGMNRIEEILKIQKTRKENKLPLGHILLVFDDFITNSQLNKRRGIFTKIFSQARHYNVSIILTSQSYTLIPSPVRRLAMYCMVFKTGNLKERKSLIDELCNFVDENTFEAIYDTATQDRYSFLWCMINERKFLKNFEYVLKSQFE